VSAHDESTKADDPIEAYLDQLLVTLPGAPRQIRHTLAEAEAHLLDAAAAGVAAGLDQATSRAAAVRQLGPVSGLADRPRLGPRLTPALRRRLVLAGLWVGGLGGVAVGIGGVIAWLVRTVWGNTAIATPFPAGSYSAADCARWLAAYPSAHDCVTAMTADHADDFLRNAAACGVLGALALGVYLLLRPRWANPAVTAALPRASEDIVGAGLALLATVLLVGQGVDAVVVTRANGAGQPLSLAATALLAATVLAGRAVGRRRSPLT